MTAASLPFMKMHGLGNDFVVLDLRASSVRVGTESARRLADRKRGIGCDQVISILPARDPEADAFMGIHNHDGSEVGACGNATRCVAQIIMNETGREKVIIETLDGLLPCYRAQTELITVQFPKARFDWQNIPLSREMNTLSMDFTPIDGLGKPGAANVGNPHVIFMVDDAERFDLESFGSSIEHDPLFPERVNVSLISKTADGFLRQRVWERGAGITQACGSGACAAMAVAHARGLVSENADIQLDGGVLHMAVDSKGHILKTGPATTAYTGSLCLDDYALIEQKAAE